MSDMNPLLILLLLIILQLPLLIHGIQKSVQKRQFSVDGNNVVAVPMDNLHELKKRVSQVSKLYLHTNIIHTKNNLCKCIALPSYFNLTFSVSKAALTIFCICMDYRCHSKKVSIYNKSVYSIKGVTVLLYRVYPYPKNGLLIKTKFNYS